MAQNKGLAPLRGLKGAWAGLVEGFRGMAISLRDGDFWAAWAGRSNPAGQVVNERTALQLSAVFACVRLLANTIGAMPLGYYRDAPRGRVALGMNDDPLVRLLRFKPNASTLAVNFWQAIVASMMLRGNGYAEKKWGSSPKRLVALDFLLPQFVERKCRQDGTPYYTYYDPVTATSRDIAENDMFHVPAFTLDGVYGVSPISLGANVFGAAQAAEDAAAEFFGSGMQQAGIIKYGMADTSFLKPDQRQMFKESYRNFVQSKEAAKAMILEAGMTFDRIGISPSDSQLLETRSYNVEEICRWFGVDPSLVGHGSKDSNWGTGLEQKNLQFLTFGLGPWLEKIEQAIRAQLVPVADQATHYAEFNIDGLLRADSAGRAAFYSAMLQNGVYTRNEVRRKENLPEMDGGDVLTVQVNLIPLDQLGKDPATDTTAKARAAVRAFLGVPEDEA